jgi:hypothetical protein
VPRRIGISEGRREQLAQNRAGLLLDLVAMNEPKEGLVDRLEAKGMIAGIAQGKAAEMGTRREARRSVLRWECPRAGVHQFLVVPICLRLTIPRCLEVSPSRRNPASKPSQSVRC